MFFKNLKTPSSSLPVRLTSITKEVREELRKRMPDSGNNKYVNK